MLCCDEYVHQTHLCCTRKNYLCQSSGPVSECIHITCPHMSHVQQNKLSTVPMCAILCWHITAEVECNLIDSAHICTEAFSFIPITTQHIYSISACNESLLPMLTMHACVYAYNYPWLIVIWRQMYAAVIILISNNAVSYRLMVSRTLIADAGNVICMYLWMHACVHQ